ncbi:conserved hypothetical protein [Echinococcus multilocularis]|uniref:Uncharacterized protein n=1 Tax=Echinococcus multilocularis TaxID=6211 RepID=A0A068YE34_ECHMU|nr:conserved hypothetical protein [Echinococcus multilocularis]
MGSKSKSAKDKGSKGKSKGSKDSKGKNSKGSKGKGKGKGGDGAKSKCDLIPVPFEYVRPPIPPPPPEPPKPTLLSFMRRQIWYPYASQPTLEYREFAWSPTVPLCTSWGDVWVSELPFRRILRYKYEPASNRLVSLGNPVITKGEPKMIIEVPLTGRIAVLLNCPTAKSNAVVFYNPETFEEEHKIEFPYNAVDPATIPTTVDSDTNKPLLRGFDLLDESTPYGICANKDSICILFDPLQKMQFLCSHTYGPQDFQLENYFTDEKACIHLAASGGCAMSNDLLFVAATRPNRIQAFHLHYCRVYRRIDVIKVVLFANFGIDRFSFGEPFGVQIDSLGLLVANDSKVGVFHVYNVNKLPKGPCLPSLPNGETCYMGSWKINAFQRVRPGYFSLAKNGTAAIVDRHENSLLLLGDQSVMRWYDDTFLCLENVLLRPVVDPQMPQLGEPAMQDSICICSLEDKWKPIPPEELLPETWVKKFSREKDLPKEAKEGPDSKSSKKKGPKASKASKGSKGGKGKASNGSKGKKKR